MIRVSTFGFVLIAFYAFWFIDGLIAGDWRDMLSGAGGCYLGYRLWQHGEWDSLWQGNFARVILIVVLAFYVYLIFIR